MYLMSVPSVSSRYFNKINRTSYLGKWPALSLEILPDVVSKNGINVCFGEERKRLDDILCYDLELMSLLLRSFAFFSMYSCFSMRMDAVTKLRFVLNCAQICSLFDFLARLKSCFFLSYLSLNV